ncbi:MAG: hypothetical protein M9899_01355 [Bdellovibrionaceae bacterium]|nr:hypothetical protein [Pseudobdellovibrionaceae bacterium]
MTNTTDNLTGWELVDLVASSMSQSENDTWLKERLIETLEAQNIDIENIDINVLRNCAMKVLKQSLTQELLAIGK